MQEGFKSMTTGASNAFSTLGGDEIGSFFDEIRPVNKVLQLSREEFRRFRLEAAVAADEGGAELNAFGAALSSLADAGVRSEDQLLRLGPIVTNMAVAANIGTDKLSESAFLLEGAYKFSTDQVAAMFNDLRKFSADSAISTETLFEGLTDNLRNMSGVLLTQTESDRLMILSNQARLSAALSDNWQDAGNKISGVISEALSGDPAAIARATKLLGKTPEQLLDALKSGDLESVLAPLQERIRDLGDNQLGLQALAKTLEFPGTPQELALLGSKTDDFTASLARLGGEQHTVESLTKAQDELREGADAQLSAFDRMRDSFNKWVIKIGGGEVIDFMKEFNLTALASVAIIGKTALGAAAATVRWLGFGSAVSEAGVASAAAGGGMAKLGGGVGKMLRFLGPYAVVAAAAAAATHLILNEIEKTNAINKETAEKGAKLGLTDAGAVGLDIFNKKKSITRVQKQIDIDKAAGQVINPGALRELEKYNKQLAVLEGKSKVLLDAGKARKAAKAGPSASPSIPGIEPGDFDVSNLTQQPTTVPMSSAEIAALTANVQMSTGATEEKLDRNNELMEQLVVLTREQVQQGRGIAPPAVAGRAGTARAGGIGSSIAGGDL